MSKGLQALERIKSHYNDKVCIDVLDDFDIIETALKRLAVYETFNLLDEKYDDVDRLIDIKGKVTYVDKVMDTQERLLTSVSSDEIRILSSVLNCQIKNLKKKLKAIEILKETPIFAWYVTIYKDAYEMVADVKGFRVNNSVEELQQMFNLLKEVMLCQSQTV